MAFGINLSQKKSRVGRAISITTIGKTGRDGVKMMAVGAAMDVIPSRKGFWILTKAWLLKRTTATFAMCTKGARTA